MYLPDPKIEQPNLLEPGRKPSGSLMVDWSHPITKGLKSAVLTPFTGGHTNDLVLGQWRKIDGGTSSGTLGATSGLRPVRGEVEIGTNLWFKNDSNKCSSGAFPRTILADQIYTDDGASENQYLFSSGASATGNCFRIRLDRGNSYQLRLEVVGGFKVFNTGSLVGTRHMIGVVLPSEGNNATDCIGYVDGEEYSAAALQASRVLNTTSTNLAIFVSDPEETSNSPSTSGYGSASKPGKLNWVYYWERALSHAEIKSIYRDPYQFLMPA